MEHANLATRVAQRWLRAREDEHLHAVRHTDQIKATAFLANSAARNREYGEMGEHLQKLVALLARS